jgi:hypothetical protein
VGLDLAGSYAYSDSITDASMLGVCYRYESDRKVLVPEEQEAANVRRVFQLYLERQLGTASISNWMNDQGFSPERVRVGVRRR